MALLLLLLVAATALLGGKSGNLLLPDGTSDGLAVNATINRDIAGGSGEAASCAVPKRNTVYEALNELFTCLVESRIAVSDAHKRSVDRIKFGRHAGSGANQGPLLTGVFSTDALIAGHKSHRQFYDLVTLFPPELGRNESRRPEEEAKIGAYLTHLEGSAYVIDTYWTLRYNNALPVNVINLRDFVRVVMLNHWFKPYGRRAQVHRRGVMDSSGFGHVFVGEYSSRGVTGFHNWLSILAAEESGHFQYKGFERVETQPLVLASIQFGWLGKQKSLSTVAFGVETEFQLALFSACFVVKPGRKTRLRIGGRQMGVQTFTVNHQPESVASAYFVI